MRYLGITALLFALAFLSSCGGDEGGEATTIDRTPFLENIGNNLIIPRYEAFSNKSEELSASIELLVATPDAENLADARQAFRSAYLAWQGCSQFEFGPADAILLRNSINIFPTDVSQIQANISSGNYNLEALSNNAAKGLPALDYLLYGLADTDEDIIAALEDPNTGRYVEAVAQAISDKATEVYKAWASNEGNYVATFIAANGTDQGSGLGQLVNSYNEDYELNKNFKLGVPSGIKLLGEKFPEKAEGYYSGLSMELMKENYRASEAVFLGTGSNGANGDGLVDLLRDHGANELANDITAQYGEVFAAFDALPADFLGAIESNQAELQTAYDAAQSMVVLTKTEMPSVLGVQISYQDGDND